MFVLGVYLEVLEAGSGGASVHADQVEPAYTLVAEPGTIERLAVRVAVAHADRQVCKCSDTEDEGWLHEMV